MGRAAPPPLTSSSQVPLNHYIFADNALHLIMEGALMDKGDKAGWRVAHYKAAAEKLKARLTKRGAAASHGPRAASTAGRAGGGGTPNDRQAWLSISELRAPSV